MNPVVLLTHNNLELTKRAVQSAWDQTIPTNVFIFDNGSTDGTKDWCIKNDVDWWDCEENLGVSHGWNRVLNFLFTESPAKHALFIGNDVILPKWQYFELLEYNVPFVTGVAVDHAVTSIPTRMPLQENPDFSCALIRKEAWEKVGPFDEAMKLYASDCDWHVRAHRLGVPLYKANAPYFHISSSTLRLAPKEEQMKIQTQANVDREVFRALYGCLPGTPEYELLFK